MDESVSNSRSFWNELYDAQTIAIIIFCAISLYNALELLVWIAATFQRARGLYFWSLLVATIGMLPYNIGFLMLYFRLAIDAAGMVVDGIGWSALITGQSLVLYSRLGLILHNKNILKAIKWMIITNGVIWHTSTEIIHFCSQYGSALTQNRCSTGYSVVEKTQMTVFCIQEFIISSIYMWQTAKLLNVLQKRGTRKVMWELLIINTFIIGMDIGLLVVEYMNYHALEQTVKAFVYSVKLKLEFLILGKLVDLVHASSRKRSSAWANTTTLEDWVMAQDAERKASLVPQWLNELDKPAAATINVVQQSPWVASSANPYNGSVGPFMQMPAMTVEERRRRQMLESDGYSEALRSISTTNR